MQGEEDSMDEPMVEFLKAQNINEPAHPPDVTDATQNTSPMPAVLVEEVKSFEMRIPNKNDMEESNSHEYGNEKLANKSSSEISNDERKTSPSSQGRKLKKKVRRRRKSDLKRQHSFDKGDGELSDREQVLSTSDDEMARANEDVGRRDYKKKKDNTETTAKERRLPKSKSREGEWDEPPLTDNRLDELEQKHVSLSDLVHFSDGSPVLEGKFKVKSVTTELGRVCVPTVRKIFTPVVDDTNGNPCVVGYVLRSAELKGQPEDKEVVERCIRNEEVTSSLDLDNGLEYIDKSDENDNDKISNTSLQTENNEERQLEDKGQYKKAYSKIEQSKQSHKSERLTSSRNTSHIEQTKQLPDDRSESSKIKSIIEKYNKLTSVQMDEPPSTSTSKPKFASTKIKELSEVFDTDASSKHSSQEIPVPVRDDTHLGISKIGETYHPQDSKESCSSQLESKDSLKTTPTQITNPVNTIVISTSSEKALQFPPLVLSEDRNHRRHKTKLQLAKEQFLSNMACKSNQNMNNSESTTPQVSNPGPSSGDIETTNSRVKPVQKSFSSGMINTLSNSYGRLDKEATKSNESHVTKTKKKTSRSFREKFNTFRLKFKKPKSDKNLLNVGNSLDTGMNDEVDVSARTSTHSISSNCSKTSGWRRFFDR